MLLQKVCLDTRSISNSNVKNGKNKSSCNLDRHGIAWKCISKWIETKSLNSIVAHRDVNSISYYYIFEWEYIPPKTLTDFSSYIFRVL